MLDFLFRLTDVTLFLLLAGIGFLIAIIGVTVVRLVVPHELRLKDNAVVGSVSSVVGLIYGILVGVTALYLINNLSATADAVQREANGLANIQRSLTWMKAPYNTELSGLVKDYLNEVINVEWPQMESGEEVGSKGDKVLGKISGLLHSYPLANRDDELILQDILVDLRELYNARENRIALSDSELSTELWIVILVGTSLVIGINFLFGMNLYLHYFVCCIASLMAASMIFLLLTLDRPFQGEFVIEPDSFRALLKNIPLEQPVTPAASPVTQKPV